MGPNGGRLAPECTIYMVFGATLEGLDESKCTSVGSEAYYTMYLVPLEEGWVGPNGCQMGSASTVPSQALKPPGAPRLETITPLVARGGFMLFLRILNVYLKSSKVF